MSSHALASMHSSHGVGEYSVSAVWPLAGVYSDRPSHENYCYSIATRIPPTLLGDVFLSMRKMGKRRIQAWRLRSSKAWRLGGLEDWGLGGLDVWTLGVLEAWRLGGLAAWRLIDSSLGCLPAAWGHLEGLLEPSWKALGGFVEPFESILDVSWAA